MDDDNFAPMRISLPVGPPRKVIYPIGALGIVYLIVGSVVELPKWVNNIFGIMIIIYIVGSYMWINRDLTRIIHLFNGPQPRTLDDDEG
jgi:hypothetical protein